MREASAKLQERLISAGLVVGACGLTACSGEVGVRVVVQLPEEAWVARRKITHIRVEAEAGGHRSVACLFPKTSVPEALTVADADDPFACADAEKSKIDMDLEYASWDFSSERSVNIVLEDSQLVTVRASGGFAGRVGLFEASAEVDPTTSYPVVDLELAAVDDAFAFPPGCAAQLSAVRVGRFLCTPKALEACVFDPALEVGAKAHTSAVSPLTEEGCRIDNAPDSASCEVENNNEVVAYGNAFAVPPSSGQSAEALVSMKGRFASCVEGTTGPDCPLTSACTPPSTSVFTAVFPSGGGVAVAEKPRLFSCLPPSVVPVEFVVRAPANRNAVFNVGYLKQDNEATEGRCFFDLLEFDIDYISPLP